jgi:hypothetical protein
LQSKDSSCWAEELTKETPKSQLGKKLDKITLEVNYEISKKSRGGDGSMFAFVEETPTRMKPMDTYAKALPSPKEGGGERQSYELTHHRQASVRKSRESL